MTEFASHHPRHHDESRRQISRSSHVSTSDRLSDTWPDNTRILAQTTDKNESKNSTAMNKEYKKGRRSFLISDESCWKHGSEEKSSSHSSDDYNMLRKSNIRPSDSSYTRKLFWDANNSAETSSYMHNSKYYQVNEVKQNCHVAYKHNNNKTLADNQRKKLDPIYSDKKKVVDDLPPSPFFNHFSEMERLNGTSDEKHSDSLPIYRTVDQTVNGLNKTDNNQCFSRDSSHFQSRNSASNNLLSFSHKKYPDLEKKPVYSKYISPVQSQNHRSPMLNYIPFINSKEESYSVASQKLVVSEELSSRPGSSSWREEDNSNEDRSLAVNISNPPVEHADDVPPTPEKPRYPYSIEMKEGMFKTVKQGPEHETLRIHIIENFGSGNLKDGGFSWGWSIEQRNHAMPSSKTSSISKEKCSSSANRDLHRSKRRLEYEKMPGSPSPKKPKVKGSNPDGRDTKSNREKSNKVYETSEIKSKSALAVPPKHQSSYLKPSSDHGEKSSVKSSKSSNAAFTVAKKSPSVGKNFHSGALGVSPLERRKSPIYMPSSEMIPHLPKGDCMGRNSNVIDDSTMGFISSKKERCAVYSGRKSSQDVPSLKVISNEAVKKNILGLKIGRNVPFELLIDALKFCSPSKLHKVEDHNRHILRYTDCLWKKFCETEFRDEKQLNRETWKDVYWRARNLRDKKLRNLTASISNGMAKAHPERQAKWVGAGANNPERRQKKIKVEENPKVGAHKVEEISIPKAESNGKESGSSSSQKQLPNNKKRSGSESSSSNSPQSTQKPSSQSKSQAPKPSKKTLAPLMSKTKKMLNFVNRRR